MKIWVDDVRPAPDGYVWCQTVNEAKDTILVLELHATVHESNRVELIDLDHDAGDFVNEGGDYIRILDWLEATGRNYPIRIHSMNPVSVENMRRIIEKNGWKEVRQQDGNYLCGSSFDYTIFCLGLYRGS